MNRIKNKDIASILGISTAAVSLARNNKPGVSDETRAKVLSLINQSEDTHDTSESQENAKQTILLIIHKRHGEIIIDKPFFSDLIESVQMTAIDNDFMLVLSHYTPALDLNTYIDSLDMENVAGIILIATEMLSEDLQYYKMLNVPIVLLDSEFEFEQYDSVSIDNTTAILNAFKYAYDMGHRNIGYLRSSVYINNFGQRYDGFLKALNLFSLADSVHPVFSLHSNVEMSYLQMKQILEHLPPDYKMPTCFLCDLDYMAFGAMNALKEFGYKIPEDISIIGFDNVTVCEICTPPLTTIQVNRNDIGKIAANTLIQRIQHPHSYHISIHVSSELIIRKSVQDIRPPEKK